MSKSERIQVKETERYWGDFEGSLESIISSLQSELDEGWEGIELEYEIEYGDCRHRPVPYFYKHRPENDKEYAKRMKQLETQREKQKEEKLKAKERRHKEYEKLRKEFGKDTL